MPLTPRRALAATALAVCALILAPAGARALRADDSGGGAPPADNGVPAKDLIAKLVGDPSQVAGAAARAAAADELVRRGAAAVPDLVAALDDPKLRESVAGVLERIGPAAKEAVPKLSGITKGAGSPARVVAVRALGAIGADAAPSISALSAIVAFTRAKDRVEAAVAIERILGDAARKAPRAGPAGPSAVDKAVLAGCDWLLRHQSADGHWDCDGFDARCTPAAPCDAPGEAVYDPGVTGLATLALLGAPGPADKPRQDAILAALKYLTDIQDSAGCYGPRTSPHYHYNHACASLAMADALARTGRADLREPVERSVKYVLGAQNAFLGWRYGIQDKDNDTSVTAWMVKVLLRAEDARVVAGDKWQAGALAWMDKMTEGELGRCGYQQRGGPPARTNGMQNRFPGDQSESLTACGVVARLGLGRTRDDDELLAKGLELLAKRLPVWDARGAGVDFYYWMYGSEAVRLNGGRDYDVWRAALLAALLPKQGAPGRCAAGSWPAADPWSPEGGRIYSTATVLIALETCAEDPATRPALPGGAKIAIDALTKAGDEEDAALRTAARRALRKIRGSYRP